MLTREQYVAGIKNLFLVLAKEAVMKQLTASIPFLGGSFFGPIVGQFIAVILNMAISGTETAAFFQYIDMRVGGQQKDFEKAIAEMISAPEDKKEEAEQNAKLAFKNLVRFVT